MRMKRTWLALLGATAIATTPMAAAGGQQAGKHAAQQPGQQSGYVSVDVSNVRGDIARNLGIDQSQVPATVQVPVGIAANVCGVDANSLAPGQSAAAGCTATSAHTSLNSFVRNDMSTRAGGSNAHGAGTAAGDASTRSGASIPIGTGTSVSGETGPGASGRDGDSMSPDRPAAARSRAPSDVEVPAGANAESQPTQRTPSNATSATTTGADQRSATGVTTDDAKHRQIVPSAGDARAPR